MTIRLSDTLFVKTATTLVLTLLLLTTLIWGATAWFLLLPVGRQSADDMAALLILSAQTWVESAPETRSEFRRELLQAHQIKLQAPTFQLNQSSTIHPYLSRLLHQALERRTGNSITSIGESDKQEHEGWLWVDIPMSNEVVRFGFSSSRIGAQLPALFISSFIAILLLTIITALILAQRLSRPLARLSAATTTIGKGRHYSIAVEGPREIVTLVDNFNHMANEIQELLGNRTTLLAGISHDLRTPLTRLKLALAILPETGRGEMLHEMVGDIDEMELMLQQALELARGIEKKEPQENIDLSQMISQLVAPYQAGSTEVEWQQTASLYWDISPNAFSRVFANLIENAIRYGEKKPITIKLSDSEDHLTISIFDRGPGIPEAERETIFQPFYRLEQSRSVTTGGSGLGLAIVKQLCDAQGWTISLVDGVDGGTEVRVTLDKNTRRL